MRLQEIERLLEKFYNGETTLEEERRLKEFFAGDDVPPRFRAEKAQFACLRDAATTGLDDKKFESRVLREVNPAEGLLGRITERKSWFYATVGMAATILILLAVFIRFDPFPKKIHDTYSDPQVAYEEARKVLHFVSKQFNRGTDKLQPITTYDQGVRELENIRALNEGITAAGKISKYNKIEQIMTNTN